MDTWVVEGRGRGVEQLIIGVIACVDVLFFLEFSAFSWR